MRQKAHHKTRTAVGNSFKVALPCLALTLGAEAVLAQAGGSSAANAERGAALEEIMVFARRREEALQDVPIAIDVLDASDFFQRGLYNLTDVVAQSTSVYLEQGSVPQDLNLTIRGMNPTRGRPNMAILLDGIDITTESMITAGASLLVDPMLFDIEQIEIVKGPQHALYGRSAFAGAINYKTRAPGDTFAGAIETDIGDFGQRMIRGRVSGPVIKDTLSLGLSAASTSHDGFYTSPVTGGELGDRSGESYAATMRWTPGDRWDIQGRVSYEDSEFGVQPQAHPRSTEVFDIPSQALGPVLDPTFLTSTLGVRGTVPQVGERDISNGDNPRTPGQDFPGSTVEVLRGTLNASTTLDNLWGLGPVQFTSLTHLASSDSFQFQDFFVGGSPDDLPIFAEIWIDSDVELFSQEFRLQSNGDGPLTWTVGAEYWEENREVLNGGVTCLNYAPPFAPAGPSCAPTVAAVGTTFPRNADLWTRDIEHWAAYGLVSYAFNDQWELTLDARYVNEDLTAGGPDLDNSLIGIFSGPAPAPAGLITATQSDSFIAPKATLQYTYSDDVMGYLSIAEGIKPAGIGSVNGGGGTFFPENLRFEQERVLVYELGAKTDLLNNRLRVNGAVFFQDFTDKQVTSQIVDDNGFLQSRIRNADAEIYGAELDVTWYATDALRLQASYTYLQTEYTDFTQLTSSTNTIAYSNSCEVVTTAAGVSTCRVNFNGNELERAPENSFVGIASYSRELTAGINWFAELQTTFRDERYSNAANLLKFDSFWLADLRIGVSGSNWEVIAYANNLFDDDTIRDGFNTAGDFRDVLFSNSFAPVAPDSAQLYLPPPRAVGIRATYSFGR